MEVEQELVRVTFHKEGDSFEIPFAVATLVSTDEGAEPTILRLLVNDMGVVREFVAGPYRADLVSGDGDELQGEVTFNSSQFVGGYVVVEMEFDAT